MNFDYSEEQQLLADSVRRYLARDYGFEQRRRIVASEAGWSAQAWAQLAQLGVTGLAISPDHGGFGGGAVDLMGVMEAFGDALLVEPFVPTIGLGARLVSRAGNEQQQAAILPRVADGTLQLALAHTEKGARYNLAHLQAQAKPSSGGWEISGDKRVVLGAPMAATLIVSARSAKGPSLFLVGRDAAGVELRESRTLDECRVGDVTLRAVKVGAEALLGAEGGAQAHLDEAVDFATALICAEAVGAMKFACDTTLEFLKTRKQFGVSIGTFQALQHRMVDMFVAYEQARSMACLACSKVDTAAHAQERARAVSAAKVKISDACRHLSQESVQLHGGMGMTEELKVSHTFRRLTVIAQQFGDAEHHLARFATFDTIGE